MDKICEMKAMLESYVSARVCGGLDQADTKELGEAIDMIKDLAEAAYYCKITEAMDEAGEEMDHPERMGYNTSRYSNGHYAPKGRGHYSNTGRTMGYMPVIDQKPYVDAYLTDPEEFHRNMRYGYTPPVDPVMERPHRSHDSEAVNEYRVAKRNYTETKNPEEKKHMADKVNQHLVDTMATMKEMWIDADPALRAEMKAQLQTLLNDMK